MATLLRPTLLTFALVVPVDLFCAFGWEPAGALTGGLAGSGVALGGSAALFFVNPAAVATAPAALTVTAAPGVFGMPELNRLAVAVVLPVGTVRPAAGAERAGGDIYRETSLCVGAGIAASEVFTAGVTAALYHLAIRGYGSASTVGVHTGIQCRLAPAVTFGAVLRNWNSPRLGRSRERIEPEAVIGLSWKPGGRLETAWDVSRQAPYPVSLHLGFRYAPLDLFELRAGVQTEPAILAAGFAIRSGFIEAEYACQFHPMLGETHLVAVTISPGAML